MLPFLKNRDDAAMSSEDEPIKRKPDDGSDYGTLDAVAEDLLSALEKKDKSLLKAALSALCDYIKEEDIEQDSNMNGDGDDD